MLRILFFTLARFIVGALIVYFILTFIRNFIQGLTGTPTSRRKPRVQAQKPPTRTEEYKDIKDARFEEMPDPNSQNKTNQQG